MNAYESIALGEYLSGYPEDKTYDEVMGLLLNEHEDVYVWQPFARESPDAVYDLIEGLKELLEKNFIPREEKASV
jgi:hypothetical protein